jgi:uncharacterized protein YkwD
MMYVVPRASLLAACLVVCLGLAACAQKPPPEPPAAPPVEMDARERAARAVHADPMAAAAAISRYRQEHGLSAVAPDPILQKLAQAQADAMAAKNLLSHDIAGNLTARFDAARLGKTTAIENVSAGDFSLAEALSGWQKSPGHNANLLDPKMRRLGIATAYAPGTRYLVFWALDMSN